jgi:hypothetical protein
MDQARDKLTGNSRVASKAHLNNGVNTITKTASNQTH